MKVADAGIDYQFPRLGSGGYAADGLSIESRIATSAREFGGVVTSAVGLDTWLTGSRKRLRMSVERVPLGALSGWDMEPATGNIVHSSGKFFRVEGLDVHVPGALIERWSQPIIVQPEVGILGMLVKEFGGVLHCLVQAKFEPGNCNGVQISPTVQATRSNYSGVHGGRPVPYLDYFLDAGGKAVLADVRQSEQGSWFRHKRNRNMVIETTSDVELRDGFCWVTLGQLYELLSVDDLVNMDTRTVLSCLPVSGPSVAGPYPQVGFGAEPGFHRALVRSCGAGPGSRHTTGEILSWITGARSRREVDVRQIPLNAVRDWGHTGGRYSHERGLFFDVIGVSVHAAGREVARWHQPMLAPRGTGLVAMLVRRIDGVLHALMHAKVEPGYLDVLELAPTVQCIPDAYDALGAELRPPFLDDVLTAASGQIRFDTMHSEEGGRFMHARTRYLVIETDADIPAERCQDFRWVTLHQLGILVRHSHYLNVQARSMLACLHSLLACRPHHTPLAGMPLAA